MGSVSSTLKLFDHMSKPLQSMMNGVNMTTNSMDKLARTLNQNIKIEASLKAASNSARNFGSELNNLSNNQNRASNNQNNLNNSFSKGVGSVNGLTSKLRALATAYVGIEAIKKGMQVTDDYTNQSARLALINDGSQTQAELQDKIFQSSQRARAGYGDSINAVSKLGLLAKDAFSGTDEIIAFNELMNKSFKISGASTSEASNGMYQLTQAMASGRLQGDEFKSIMENAPMLAQTIADYTGVSMGELRKLSSEGAITSDIIKKALLGSADEINKAFKTMPMTFSDIWTNIKNTATKQFSEIIQKVSAFINTDTGTQVVQNITTAIGVLVVAVGFLLDMLMGVTSFFNDNWSAIAPIVWGVVGAFLAYNAALAIGNIITGTSITGKVLHAIWSGLQAGALFVTTAAQYGLNAALLACPLTWIIALIIGLILALAALIAYCEPVRTAFADTFQCVANAVSIAFGCIVQTIENALNWIIEKINKVLTMVNEVSGAAASLWGGEGTSLKINKVDFGGYKKFGENFYKEVGKTGSKAIKSFSAENIKSALSEITGTGNNKNIPKVPKEPKIPRVPGVPNIPGMGKMGKIPGGGGGKGLDKSLEGANGHLKNIDDKIDVSNEHLEMMRDIAEKESVQNFVTLTPTVQVTTGDIKEEADINKIIGKIETYMTNELVSSAEGVYA